MFDQVTLDTLFAVPQRNGLTKPKRLRGEGVKMVNMGELFAERRIQELPMDRVPCSERELETNRLEKGDLLFARQSLTLEGAGQSSIFLGDQEDVVFESHLIRCRLDKSRVDPLYYFYFFESKFGKQRIGSIVEQVAAAGIRGSDLIKLPVFLPSLSDQKAIAHILGTLDDKIELNQKMNQTLEEIAKAIFKSWFVDFDPVRAKAEGRPTGLPPEISDLFPDELVDSEIGEIPKGWNESTFGELADIQNGYAFKSKDWSEEGTIPVVKIGNVKPMLVDVESCSRVNSQTVVGLERFRLSSGDALVGMTGYVGEVGLVPKVDELPYLNQRVGKLIAQAPSDYSFMVIMARRKEFKEEVERLGTGSAQANVSASSIKSIKVILPPCDLKQKFGEIINPFIDRILTSAAEIEVLSELRDTLLPKLISGELRIPDAEKFLEEAGI